MGKFQFLNFDRQISGAPVTKVDQARHFVKLGQKNNWPDLLLDLYAQSPTHHAAIDFETDCVIAGGINYEAMQTDGSQLFPNYYQTFDDVIRNAALDMALFGGYYLQLIKNRDNKTLSIYNIPYHKVRAEEMDGDGCIMGYFISNDWSNISKYPPVRIDAFDMLDYDKLKMGVPYLYAFKKYSPTNDYYNVPDYLAAIKAIQAEAEFCNYDLKSATNSFTPAGILQLAETNTDEEREAIVRNIQNMFQGSNNSNNLMITFNSNVENDTVKFTPFSQSSEKYNIFADANERTQNRILAGHRVSACLIGLPQTGNNGFNSEADQLKVAYQLYMSIKGNAMRRDVVGAINAAFKLQSIDTEIILKPMPLFEDEPITQEPETDTTPDTTQDISDDNISEKVEQ